MSLSLLGSPRVFYSLIESILESPRVSYSPLEYLRASLILLGSFRDSSRVPLGIRESSRISQSSLVF